MNLQGSAWAQQLACVRIVTWWTGTTAIYFTLTVIQCGGDEGDQMVLRESTDSHRESHCKQKGIVEPYSAQIS